MMITLKLFSLFLVLSNVIIVNATFFKSLDLNLVDHQGFKERVKISRNSVNNIESEEFHVAPQGFSPSSASSHGYTDPHSRDLYELNPLVDSKNIINTPTHKFIISNDKITRFRVLPKGPVLPSGPSHGCSTPSCGDPDSLNPPIEANNVFRDWVHRYIVSNIKNKEFHVAPQGSSPSFASSSGCSDPPRRDLHELNPLVDSKNVIKAPIHKFIISNDKITSLGLNFVNHQGFKERVKISRNSVDNIESEEFHVAPQSFSPSSSSHGYTDPHRRDLYELNPLVDSKSIINTPTHKFIISNDKITRFHVLPKGPVPPSGPSHGCSTPPCGDPDSLNPPIEANNVFRDRVHRYIVSNIKNKKFHVAPQGSSPSFASSSGCSDPPRTDLHELNPLVDSKNVIKAPIHKFISSNNKIMRFHVLPKGPVPPSGPSHGCSTPPCGDPDSLNPPIEANNVFRDRVHRYTVSNINVAPQGSSPSFASSSGCSDPPRRDLHELNPLVDSKNVIKAPIHKFIVSNVKITRFHALPKGPVPPSGPSHGCSFKERVKISRNSVDNIESKEFHVAPQSFSPSSSSSHGYTDPHRRDLYELNPLVDSKSIINTPTHKFIISNDKITRFHVLPKGPVPPSGPSHGCSTPPCGDPDSLNPPIEANNVFRDRVHRYIVSNIKSKEFHVAPQGFSPSFASSSGCSDPPGKDLHELNSLVDSKDVIKAPIHKFIVSNLKITRFHALPKGPVPPSGPSHGCSTTPC
ncbi:unnamed protein product [Sphenostylis stenocarpa]|uniref:Uncharacterized protein n=1 Tax=Sphenostylis stenocarpa TaxID=92480 RepID=A0AA86T9A2_9FABA|nr:unnamed protein product [Sphenostylis stenocarpa]